jgi:BirA family biotin operon repressor/biotin-[acetyl-CoA-carboxylase] ligase
LIPRKALPWGGDPAADAVADLLASRRGTYLSGESLSRRLKVSRSAIWKAVGRLKREGYGIAASPHLGYRLDTEPDAPLPRLIRRGLKARLVGAEVHSFHRIASTNDHALALARAGCPDGTVVVADAQWGGRGRMGRRWHSPPGSGLWVSVVLRPRLSASGTQALTFLGAVAAAHAVRALHRLRVSLKWPNDIYLADRKMGGVLTEVSAEADLIQYAVIGVGLNVNVAAKAFPEELREIATSVSAQVGDEVARLPLLRRLLEEIDARYASLQRHGAGPLVDEARTLTPMIGRIIRVQHLSQAREGTVVGLDTDGALLLRSAAGTVERLLAGDVSILR